MVVHVKQCLLFQEKTCIFLYKYLAFKDGLLLKLKKLTYIATQYKLCPCGRYRQLYSVLYPNKSYTEIVKNNI